MLEVTLPAMKVDRVYRQLLIYHLLPSGEKMTQIEKSKKKKKQTMNYIFLF